VGFRNAVYIQMLAAGYFIQSLQKLKKYIGIECNSNNHPVRHPQIVGCRNYWQLEAGTTYCKSNCSFTL